MSQCFRTLPGRLSSLVSGGGGRKPLSKLDRLQLQLQKNVESSAFLKQFLGTQRALSVRANTAGKSVPFVGCTLPPNLSLAYLDVHNQWNEKPRKRHADDESKSAMTYWVQNPRKPHKTQRLSVAFLKSRKHVAPIGIASDNVEIFQAQSVVGNYKDKSFLDNDRICLESLHSSQETNINKSIVFTSDDTSTLKTSPQQSSPRENEGKPSQEQLQSIVDCLSQDLPKLFVKPQNFSIYTDDIIFINNIRGVTTRGLTNYAKQLILLRCVGHIKFAHVKFDIMKITMHPENSTVQVRWRIRGVTGWKVFSMFWKYKVWKIHDAISADQEVWYDGFSTFYVNADGKVYKHIADKMMPDQDTATKKEDLRMAPKLALFTSLTNIFSNNEDSLN
ncbi:uncharacterized protein LOC112457098 [Temnothorax curvispinosus]|uniref:Uncharacterized protein LOC112457098 n=1 Tax=Temnothorax curvispinosus TaxID=300111 RepID=A0A6J1Q0U6_9HYME|nr:uncharacterized protein LOC112457098 [Temnothorax curvispinosus]